MKRDTTNRDDTVDHGGQREPAAIVLTVLCHPDPRRIGDRAVVPWQTGAAVEFARDTPTFDGDGGPRPLDDRGISRRPIELCMQRDGLRIEVSGGRPYQLDGRALAPTRLSLAALTRGVSLSCGRRVLVSIEARAAARRAPPAPIARILVGGSVAMEQLRDRVALLAPHRFPVTIVGAPDTGRRAVAEALHAAGVSPDGPYVAVAADGSTADAITALVTRARGGTLCLQDVDRLPEAAQRVMLRVLDGEATASAARVVTTTAVDLEAAAAAGRFEGPLAYRLCTAVAEVPPLRARRVDIPALFVAALDAHLDRAGGLGVQAPGWLPPSLVEVLLQQAWPGNLRELDNLALEVALGSHDAPRAALPARWSRPRPTAVAPPSPPPTDALAWAVPPERLRAALRRHGWRVRPVSAELGVSRNTIYSMMGRLGIRRPSDLSAADILEAFAAVGSADLDALADRLEVSARGLKLRLGALDLSLE